MTYSGTTGSDHHEIKKNALGGQSKMTSNPGIGPDHYQKKINKIGGDVNGLGAGVETADDKD